ncbi:hypothetical protein GGS21DRAFT_412382 [Xylaria nigripes]|nr:hypothetical protein GGS21DRAFT_412382 [Xylaria nigripes]
MQVGMGDIGHVTTINAPLPVNYLANVTVALNNRRILLHALQFTGFIRHRLLSNVICRLWSSVSIAIGPAMTTAGISMAHSYLLLWTCIVCVMPSRTGFVPVPHSCRLPFPGSGVAFVHSLVGWGPTSTSKSSSARRSGDTQARVSGPPKNRFSFRGCFEDCAMVGRQVLRFSILLLGRGMFSGLVAASCRHSGRSGQIPQYWMLGFGLVFSCTWASAHETEPNGSNYCLPPRTESYSSAT